MIDLKKLTIEDTHNHLLKGDFKVTDLAEAYLSQIDLKNKKINAYLEVFDDVLDQARESQKKIDSKKNIHKLSGIPLAIKDNILIKGRRAGSASKILEGYYSTYDATAISKLKDLGVIFLGRTNMDEFAMGGSTENSAYGSTLNPVDETRVPGGSSGGSASAVAMDGALSALGSDTGGSVRQPASFCGLVGLKPTYGSVSRHGLMAMGSSLDQIGPITKTVNDAEIIFEAIKGKDNMDATSDDFKPVSKVSGKDFTVGVPTELFNMGGIDEDVISNFKETVDKLKASGVKIKDISIPNIADALPVYYVIMPAEVSSNLARFDGVKYGALTEGSDLLGDYKNTRGQGFGKEVRRRIILGTYVLSAGYYDAYYNKANIVRGMLQNKFREVFSSVDAVLTPTTPTPAFKVGEKTSDPLSMYLADIFTVTANIVGIPALSLPSGFANREGKNLPLGIQIMSSHGGENILFDLGRIIEKNNS